MLSLPFRNYSAHTIIGVIKQFFERWMAEGGLTMRDDSGVEGRG